MQTTSNYKLKKPDGTDPVEIQDFNDNADILDAELAKRAGKATATTGADGLMSKTDKSKLDGIAAGANNYTHPATHPTSMISQDASNRFTSDSEKLTWNNHVNSRSNPHGITPAQIGAATTSEVADLKKSVSDGKQKVAAAITAKGQSTAQDAAFDLMAANIGRIQTGVDTSTATADASKLLSGYTAYSKGSKITGTIPSRGAATITPSTAKQTIPAGQYLSGTQTIAGDVDLVSANIKAGANIFGVAGKSTVVDTADANATADHILTGKVAYEKGNRVVGNIPNFTGVVTHIKNRLIRNNRFEVAVDKGYHECWFANNSYEYMELNEVAETIGLTPEKLAAGNTVCGVAGTYGGLIKIETPVQLYIDRYNLAGTSVGNYALFAGGEYGNNYCSYSTVDAYNTNLIRSTPTTLSIERANLAGTSVGNYALFAGGRRGYPDNSDILNVVDAYNLNLTRQTITTLNEKKYSQSGASIGNYALFAGGYGGYGVGIVSTVEAYDTSLTRSTPMSLSIGRFRLAGERVGNYALFAGGNGDGRISTVDAYNTNLTKSTPMSLSVGRDSLAGARVGNYILFAGGDGGRYISDSQNTVDAYNTSLTRSTPAVLSIARQALVGVSSANYALFAGGCSGYSDSLIYYDTVDTYDTNLTRSTTNSLSVERGSLAGAKVGNYILFAGGNNGNRRREVDAYYVGK